MGTLKKGMQPLYDFLKAHNAGEEVSFHEVMSATGWKKTTFTTYLKKNKFAAFMIEAPNDRLKIVRNGATITEAEVAAALTQKTAEMLTLAKGERLTGKTDTYVLDKKRGEGAVGHVWEAIAESTGKRVAVKILNPRPDLLDPALFGNVKTRFSREVRNGMKLNSEALVQYLDQGLHRDQPFVVMELANESLRDVRNAKGKLSLKDTLPIVGRSAQGLKFLHAEGCIHRDVKPENILICARGAVVGDLGIVQWGELNPAFTSAGTVTQASMRLGSWFYMAPEQQNDPHEAVPASDVYALGVTWYELLTGATPSPAVFAAGKAQSPSGEPAVNELISRMTKFDPNDRPDLDEVINVIEKLQATKAA